MKYRVHTLYFAKMQRFGWWFLVRFLSSHVDFLKQSTVFQVVFDNDIRDGIKDEGNVIGIGSTCEMGINFFCIFALV